MRLLKFDNAINRNEDFDFTLRDYHNEVPPYAILSHRWGDVDDEVSYLDLQNKALAVKKPGYQKIKSFCIKALGDGLTHAWVDTCCIDKTSSAELSEAINSMFEWYKCSTICYVYLADVPDSCIGFSSSNSALKNSQWFTRGWTLQEMIAPTDVRFYTRKWDKIGQKNDMSSVLCDITGIPEGVLLNPQTNLRNICIAQKMSWASRRQTTRVEDRAYSLIGLFDISLPILYGEGLRSFARLQEELIRKSFDHTIFAWQLTESHSSGLLAHSPDAFMHSGDVRPMVANEYHSKFGLDGSKLNYSITNIGLHIQLPRRRVKSHFALYIAFLACTYRGRQSPIFIYIRQNHGGLPNQFFRTRKSSGSIGDGVEFTSRLDKLSFSSQENIWVVEPEQSWAVRPLIPDEIALKGFASKEPPEVYHIHIYHQGKAINVYPLADNIDYNEISIETESNKAWTALIHLRKDCIAYLVFAVINNKLMVHLRTNGRSHLPSKDDEDQSSRAIYNESISSLGIPSTQAILNHGFKASGTAKDSEEVEIVDIRQETYISQDPVRKVFLLWLRTGIRKDFLSSKDRMMTAPEVWMKSLRDLLRNCEFLIKPIAFETPLSDHSQHINAISAHDKLFTSYEDPYQMIDSDLGIREAGLSANDPQNMPQISIDNINPEWNILSCVFKEAMKVCNYRGLSEDSYSFNRGFFSGRLAAYGTFSQDDRDGLERINYSYARGFASTFATNYPLNFESGYILAHNTIYVPKSVSDPIYSYAEGYATGYIYGCHTFKPLASDIEADDQRLNYSHFEDLAAGL